MHNRALSTPARETFYKEADRVEKENKHTYSPLFPLLKGLRANFVHPVLLSGNLHLKIGNR